MSTILVIDSNAEMTKALRLMLEVQGFEVAAQHNYSEALQLMNQQNWQPDVIICDVAAPPIDGISLLEHVRTSEHWYQVPFILMSHAPSSELQRHAFDLGADALIAKPLKFEALSSTLRNLGIVADPVRV